jgi:hypothetical protein
MPRSSWVAQAPDQRNRLLGKKGGKNGIHSVEEQSDGVNTRSSKVYETTTYHDGRLLLSSGKDRGEVEIGVILATMPAGELKAFVAALKG